MAPSPPPSAPFLPRTTYRPTTYTLTTTKSRPGDGLQGMTVECEAVSMAPKVPIWPADAPVPECHKKDSIVSSSSKGKGKGKGRRMSSSPAADGGGEGDDENSGESSESSFHNDEFLDINCQPLVKSTSRISRFSAYGISAPESPRRASSSTTAIGDDEPGEWWLEKKRRLSNTSFVSPAGRRASLSYGTVDCAKLERGLCKRCFQPRIPEATFERQNRRDACVTATWICLANAFFPFCGAGMVWWSIRHPEQPGPGFLSIIPFSLWMIFITVVFSLWRPSPRPRCTCPNLSDRRRRSSTSPLLERARQDLDELERWRWEKRRRGSKASKFSSTSIVV